MSDAEHEHHEFIVDNLIDNTIVTDPDAQLPLTADQLNTA